MTRRTGTLTVETKLWVSPDMAAWLDREAERLGWTRQQVIRHAIARFPYKARRKPGPDGAP